MTRPSPEYFNAWEIDDRRWLLSGSPHGPNSRVQTGSSLTEHSFFGHGVAINRFYDTAMDFALNTSLHTESPSAGMIAYQELKALLLLGEVPIGLRLREERLAERLGMSRTPVREALLRLHAENFLDRHPEGGYKAINPSAQVMVELYDVRRALELFALQNTIAGESRDQGILSELRDEWASMNLEADCVDAEFVLLDEDFHQRLALSAGNLQLAEELRRINERIRPVRSQDFIAPGRIATTIEQHLTILDAVLIDDLTIATRLLDHHISESQSLVEAASVRVLERMLSVGERDNGW